MRAIIKPRLEREAGLAMIVKKRSKKDFFKAIFGVFFVTIGMLAGVFGTVLTSDRVYADPEDRGTSEVNNTGETDGNTTEEDSGETDGDGSLTSVTKGIDENSCKSSLGEMGWLVCPTTGKIAEAVDWLYGKLQDILTIEPISTEDGSPIYEIWKYCLSLTNIVFIIFLLVVIYSQITGVGITNYGIKKALPKLIITAILVNLSFLICSLAVDLSNIIGNGLRGIFTAVEESVVASGAGGATATAGVWTDEMKAAYVNQNIAAGAGLGMAIVGGVIAVETGVIWMLIPVVLGAIVAVVTGLITIALRQAVVALLIMIAPLAIVAYILPNTERWFRKWRDLLIKMLVFYPMFSLLFGASSLAGFAITASAKDGFGMLLGVAVQVFPLFFSWKLMQLSGTFLGTINARMRGMAERPLATNRAWADSHRLNTKQRYLASGRAITPSLRLMQFVSNRRIAREAEIAENAEVVKNRGLAYNAAKHYKRDGTPSKEGENAYEAQARNMEYQRIILRDKNNMNKGLGQLEVVKRNSSVAQKARLDALDMANVNASDFLKAEQARGEKIDYENAMGFHKRMEAAINAHMDDENGYALDPNTGRITRRSDYKFHFTDNQARAEARARYSAVNRIMEGNVGDVQYAAATAAQAYDSQKKILETKMQKYFELTPPTKDLEYRLSELTKRRDAATNIDSIIPGLRILNQRGDTDLVRQQLVNVLKSQEGVELGTHASQALASFLMFEVKDNDPWLRRFGKYINLETANVYNKNKRKIMNVTYDEYVKGYHDGEPDKIAEGDPNGRMYAKKGMVELMKGTSLDGIERTAMDNYVESLMDAYSDENGVIQDYDEFERRRKEVDEAIEPQFISAMRKMLSGSEQINSMVKSATGYEQHQRDDDGTYELRSIFEDEKLQRRLGPNAERYKQYMAGRSKRYLKSLVPSQVLSMRSDELAAYEKLLPEWYEEENPGAHDEWKRELETRHGDWTEEDIEEAIRTMESREMFRQCFDMGVLEQISRTNARRGVLDAKPKLRKLLGLDGDDGHGGQGLSKYVREKNGASGTVGGEPEDREVERIIGELETIYRQRREAQSSAPSGASEREDGVIYDEATREIFIAHIRDIRETDADAFYEETLDYLKEQLTEESRIVAMYEDKRRNGLATADVDTLRAYLMNILSDPDNY